MKSKYLIVLLFISFILILIISCNNKDEEEKGSGDTWDINKNGIPRFVQINYIELDNIYRISKFRSSIGHDYSDAFESCRSMKHYFEPRSDADWSTIKVYSPVSGKITRVEQEWAGTKLEIASDNYPAFRFSIFHINPSTSYQVNDPVTAGQQLGMHIGSQTMSDISVLVNDPTRQGLLISYFETLTDAAFTEFSSRGVSTRNMMTIPKDTRDAFPLICSGDTFVSSDTLENWIYLN
jgi:hypothetical protein